MADTEVALIPLLEGVAVDVAGDDGEAIVAANTHTVTLPRGVRPEQVILRLTNTTAASKAFTVKAGSVPPGSAGESDDLVVTLADGSSTPTVAFVTLASSRFLTADGTVVVTVAANTTGYIAAFQVGR